MTLTIVVAGLIAVGVAGLGGLMTEIGPWYRNLRKPPWQPPDWLFGPAWTLILGMAAAAGVLAWNGAADSAGRSPDWAMVELPVLWLSILALIFGLAPFSTTASWLLTPYISWVSFAGCLNFAIVRMNAPFGAAR
jgi:tryptophan-rich sensory protein